MNKISLQQLQQMVEGLRNSPTLKGIPEALDTMQVGIQDAVDPYPGRYTEDQANYVDSMIEMRGQLGDKNFKKAMSFSSPLSEHYFPGGMPNIPRHDFELTPSDPNALLIDLLRRGNVLRGQ